MVSVDFLPNIGGIAAHVYGISKAMAEQGHKVHVLNIRYGLGENATENIDGIMVHRLFVRGKLRKIRFLFWLWTGTRYLGSVLASEKFDILHWHGLLNDSYLMKLVPADCAKIFTNHSSTYLKMLKNPLGRIYLKWLLCHANLIIAPSQELALKSRIVQKSSKIKYIPNGVDTRRFNPNTERRDIRALQAA